METVEHLSFRLSAYDVIKNMSASEKNRLITENVVQSTLHFQKRIEKMLPKIIEPGFLEHKSI